MGRDTDNTAGSGRPADEVPFETMDDEHLVARLRTDDAAMAEVFRRYGGLVHGCAVGVLHVAAAATDLTQEIFLTLWRNPERFDHTRGSLGAFLAVQTRRRAVDVLRSDQARSRREAKYERDAETALSDAAMWQALTAGELHAALAALDDHRRQPIELAFFGGHSYREVADLLGEAEGTVKSRIRSGLLSLRGALGSTPSFRH